MVLTVEQKDTQRTSVGATEIVTVSFRPMLRSGELLVSTLVAEVTTSDLAIANKQVSTTALVVRKTNVAIGQAVLFSITGQQAGTTYRVRVTATTDSTPARVIPYDVLIECVA